MQRCSFCGEPSDGLHREVVAWVKKERGHGFNHLVARKETGRVACSDCIYDIRNGQEPNAPKLFRP
jgi:hypothetical protein